MAHGGITGPEILDKFLRSLKRAFLRELESRGIRDVWPCFVVADVGTNLLPENSFDRRMAERLVMIARRYSSFLKGHYTDYVRNPDAYPLAGMGGANISSECAHTEYFSLKKLGELEEELHEKSMVKSPSRIDKMIVMSGR